MTNKIIITDQYGERYEAELDIYRVQATLLPAMRVSRGDHIDHKGKHTKRPWVHLHFDREAIAAILDGVGRIL